MGEFCDWKLELMACKIFRELWKSYKETIREAYSIYSQCFKAERKENGANRAELIAKIEKAKKKLENLTNMRMDGEITKEEYQEYRRRIGLEVEAFERQILQNESECSEDTTGKLTFEQLNELLSMKLDFTQPKMDRGFLEQIIYRIIPISQDEFAWYLNLLPREGEWCGDAKKICNLVIDYDEAKNYRNKRKGMLRKNQWRDLTIHIYV